MKTKQAIVETGATLYQTTLRRVYRLYPADKFQLYVEKFAEWYQVPVWAEMLLCSMHLPMASPLSILEWVVQTLR